eukprot:3368932-Pleurochrysis_carterae.AAC.1
MVKRLTSRRGRLRRTCQSKNTDVTWDAWWMVCACATYHASAAVRMRMAQLIFNAAYVIDKCVDAIDREMTKGSMD